MGSIPIASTNQKNPAIVAGFFIGVVKENYGCCLVAAITISRMHTFCGWL